jgi:DNA-binding SARP family transcriptional activator
MRSFWRIDLLGTLRATRQRWVVNHFRTRKAADLLAVLCLDRRSRGREELIELF